MIEDIIIKNVTTFSDEEISLKKIFGKKLSRINFFYGSNGSGKTTISRIIDEAIEDSDCSDCTVTWEGGEKLKTFVYNRDFIDKNFNQPDSIAGVFTIGEGVELKKEIDAIKEGIDLLKEHITSLQEKKKEQERENNDIEEYLEGICWKQKKKYEVNFDGIFKGFVGSKEAFRKKVIGEYEKQANDNLPDLEELKQQAKLLYDKELEKKDRINSVDTSILREYEEGSISILQESVVGKENVDIAEMIKKLGNSDWVKQGRSYYEQNSSFCPFCQQKTEEEFAASLEEYFDEAYEANIKKIGTLLDDYKREGDTLTKKIRETIDHESVKDFPDDVNDVKELKTKNDRLSSLIKANLELLEKKKEKPSETFSLDSTDILESDINKIIENINRKIDEHNRLVDNRKAEQSKLNSNVWQFIVNEIKDTLKEKKSKQAEINQALKGIQDKSEKKQGEQAQKERELKEMESRSTSIKPTLDKIKDLLKRYNFNSFSITLANDGISYKIVRSNGEDAKETLSEGERSFITFLYFYHLISGSEKEEDVTKDRVVVFDDPISSLDSDVLFIVSTLIRDVILNITNSTKSNMKSIKQVFVLTHNVYFHREVTFGNKKDNKDHTFWEVRKSEEISCVECYHNHNPISTSYELLWHDIVKDDINSVTLANILRRILEHYFKILGGTALNEIEKQLPDEYVLECKDLLSWANAGSHGIPDDFDCIPSGRCSLEHYRTLFKGLFEKLGHIAHYEMMMDTVKKAQEATKKAQKVC